MGVADRAYPFPRLSRSAAAPPCDPAAGCKFTPRPAGTACDEGDACTTGDACLADGTCGPGAVVTVSLTPEAFATYQYPCGQYVCGSYCCAWSWGHCNFHFNQHCTQYCTAPVSFSVTSSPAGISCGAGQYGVTGKCTTPFLNGTTVTLTSSSGATVFSGDCTGVGFCMARVTATN